MTEYFNLAPTKSAAHEVNAAGDLEPRQNNVELSILASAARTVSDVSAAQENRNARGVQLFLDVTAASGTSPTLDIKIQAQDLVSGKWFDVPGAAFVQVIAAGQHLLSVYPGIAETAGVSASEVLARTWRVAYTLGGTAPSFTFSLGGVLIN